MYFLKVKCALSWILTLLTITLCLMIISCSKSLTEPEQNIKNQENPSKEMDAHPPTPEIPMGIPG